MRKCAPCGARPAPLDEHPFTGPSSDFGIPLRQGIELAVAEINTAGGYLGRPLELVVYDDKGDPDTGLKASQDLAKQGVVATIGFCNTGVAAKSLEVYQSAQLPLIIPCATGTPLTAKYPPAQSYIFRTSARDSIQAPFVVEDIVKRGWNRVAIFADTTGYGEAGLKDVQEALAARKLQAVHVTRFPLGVTDLGKELQAAREAGANVIFSYTVGPEEAVIANSRKDIGWKVPLVGAWPLSFPFFIDGAKDAAEGALMAQTFIAEPSNERRAAFLTNFKRKHGERMAVPMAAAQGYDATYLLTYALFGIPMSTYDPAALECLAAIVEEGGFERAAQRLNVTQSAVSQRLRALEAQVGSVLIVRSRPLRPTSRGSCCSSTPSSCACCAPTWSATCRSWPPARRGARARTSASPSPSMPTALPPGPWARCTTWCASACRWKSSPTTRISPRNGCARARCWAASPRSSRRCAAARWCRWGPCTMWRWPRPLCRKHLPKGLTPHNFRDVSFLSFNRKDDMAAEFVARTFGLKRVALNHLVRAQHRGPDARRVGGLGGGRDARAAGAGRACRRQHGGFGARAFPAHPAVLALLEPGVGAAGRPDGSPEGTAPTLVT
jgi:branched-chain amino acid transport system substrate-binding protein